MTLKERVIVSAYTGYLMVQGEELKYLYEYAEKVTGRKGWQTIDFAEADLLQNRAKDDFIKLCKESRGEITIPRAAQIAAINETTEKFGELCTDDKEKDHRRADELVSALLKQLGAGTVADEYDRLRLAWWYA